MEAFSLLKYWRGSGGGGGATTLTTKKTTNAQTTNTTTSFSSDDDDDGPFFDLEFTLPDENEQPPEENQKLEEDNNHNSPETINSINVDEEENNGDDDECEDCDDENEVKVTLSSSSSSSSSSTFSGSSNEHIDSTISSSDENLFFKGRLVPIEPSSVLLTSSSEGNAKFPTSLFRSATKFRVLMLKLKKTRGEKAETIDTNVTENGQKEKETQNQKNFTVKFVKVEEVPIVSLFTRDNSKAQKRNNGDDKDDDDEKKLMQKYLKMVKPLYVRVSKRYSEKLRFSGQLSFPGGVNKPPSTAAEVGEVAAASDVKGLKQGNLTAGLRVVRKHLGKSKSSSLATASATAAAAGDAPSASRRRDDSLLQQEDGIQSAILHCKRSFNASRDAEASILSRSASDPSK